VYQSIKHHTRAVCVACSPSRITIETTTSCEANCIQPISIITFRLSRRRHEMFGGHGCLCVRVFLCLSVPHHMSTVLHGRGWNLGNGRGAH